MYQNNQSVGLIVIGLELVDERVLRTPCVVLRYVRESKAEHPALSMRAGSFTGAGFTLAVQHCRDVASLPVELLGIDVEVSKGR